MRIYSVQYDRMMESFRIEFANGSQTELRYGRAAEVYENYAPVWKWFQEAVRKAGETIYTDHETITRK